MLLFKGQKLSEIHCLLCYNINLNSFLKAHTTTLLAVLEIEQYVNQYVVTLERINDIILRARRQNFLVLLLCDGYSLFMCSATAPGVLFALKE
jgi:hypothetical protein